MDNSTIQKIIKEYIPTVIHMSLATSDDNIPWITELHFSYDEDYNFYFLSRPSRRHSKELIKNRKISGNIVKQFGIGESPTGVYFEGAVQVLSQVKKEDNAFKTYAERFGISEDVLEEQDLIDGHRFYMIRVRTFYLYDENSANPSGKHTLDWNLK